MVDACSYVEHRIRNKQTTLIFTPNLHHVSLIRQRPEFFRVLSSADVLFADGVSLVFFDRMLCVKKTQRINGTNLVYALIRLSVRRCYRVFFLGGSPNTQKMLKNRLKRLHPSFVSSGYSPPFRSHFTQKELDTMLARIRLFKPDIVFVGLGPYKQEYVLHKIRFALPPSVYIAIGGALEYVAGRKPRAPNIIQYIGLEWAFRLVTEPRRLWRRYIIEDIPALIVLMHELIRKSIIT